MDIYDVVVVGAGVNGSYIAAELAQLGHNVAVMERKRRVGEAICCTGIVGKECFNHFIGESRLILRETNSARFFSPQGSCLRMARQTAPACIINRSTLDMNLARQAENAGVNYRLGSAVKSICPGDASVHIEVDGQGGISTVRARAVVLACGFGSRLPRSLGLGSISDFTIGAQAEVETSNVDEIEVYFSEETAPGFFAWLVPTDGRRGLAGLLARRNAPVHLRKFVHRLYQQGKITSADVDIKSRGIPLRPRPRTYASRLVVVGDAAGQVKPTTGGGIYYGLLSSRIAVDVLHRALVADDLSEKTLAQYERRWRQRLGRELRIGYYARQFYQKLDDNQIERLFHLVMSNGIDKALLNSEYFSFDWQGNLILSILKHQALRPFRKLLPRHSDPGRDNKGV